MYVATLPGIINIFARATEDGTNLLVKRGFRHALKDERKLYSQTEAPIVLGYTAVTWLIRCKFEG